MAAASALHSAVSVSGAVIKSAPVAERTASSSNVSLVSSFNGAKLVNQSGSGSDSWSSKTVSNGSRVNAMLVWPPYENIKFETLSYLPPLTSEQISKQVDFITSQGWVPCLEFDRIGTIYREHFKGCGYYDGRYWTMWKLPMFGCTDSSLVLREIEECKNAYPDCYIRLLGFDSKRQVQVSGFLVQKPVPAA